MGELKNKQLQRATRLTSQSPTPTPTQTPLPESKDTPFMAELKNKQNEMKNKRESGEFSTNSLIKKIEQPKDNNFSSNSVLEKALNNRRNIMGNDDEEDNNDWNTNDEYKNNSLIPIAEPVDIVEAINVEPKKTVENRENQNKLKDLQEQYNQLYSEVDAASLGIEKETQKTVRSQKVWKEKIAELENIRNNLADVGKVVIIKKKKVKSNMLLQFFT